MKRKTKFLISNDENTRAIYVDLDNEKEILNYLNQDKKHKDKFRLISKIFLMGLKNPDQYDKENIDKKSQNVTAMKFFKKRDNDRIYCKEIEKKNRKIIVMSELLLKKKNKKVKQREKNVIHKVGGYKYEIEK